MNHVCGVAGPHIRVMVVLNGIMKVRNCFCSEAGVHQPLVNYFRRVKRHYYEKKSDFNLHYFNSVFV